MLWLRNPSKWKRWFLMRISNWFSSSMTILSWSHGWHSPRSSLNWPKKILYESFLLTKYFSLKIFFQENQLDFPPIIFDSHSHELLYPELFQAIPSTEIKLYSIDCVRKVLQSLDDPQDRLIELFNRALDDPTFWKETTEKNCSSWSFPMKMDWIDYRKND